MNMMIRTIKTIADIVSGLAAANIGFNQMFGLDLFAQAWLEGLLTPLRIFIGICGIITFLFSVMNLFDTKHVC